MTATTAKNTEGRAAFIHELAYALDIRMPHLIVEQITAQGPTLGARKARWIAACDWAAEQVAKYSAVGEPATPDIFRWIARETLTKLTYANL
jgi:hypothetical protein